MKQKTRVCDRSGDRLLLIFCAISVTAFFLFIATTGRLSPINDHVFLGTLFDGKAFTGYFDRALGRFTPLASMEYALASRLMQPSATLFYVIHAIKMALAAGALMGVLRLSGAGRWLALATWCAVFFSIGFSNSSMVLQAGELNELLLAVIFIVVILLRESGRLRQTQRGLLIVAAASGGLIATFLYKEVAFAMALTFGAAEWLRYRLGNRPAPRYAIVLLIASLAYLAFYAAWHGLHFAGSYAQSHAATSRLDAICAYAANDPVIFFVALPISVIRFWLIVTRRAMLTVFDSFLLAGLVYVATFPVLGLYSGYYLLPAYGFSLCGVAGLTANWRPRSVVAAACIALAVNNAPVALSDIVGIRNIAQNYSPFIDSLAQWIWANPTADGSPRHVVVMGAQEDRQVEIFLSMKRFLDHAGLPSTVYRLEPDRSVHAGDVLLYNPFQISGSRPPLSTPSDAPIARSGSDSTQPRWTVWKWLNECIDTVDGCRAKISGNSPYTGYAAFVQTHEPMIGGSPIPIASPAYRVGPIAIPDRMRAGTSFQVNVSVQNAGREVWPSDGGTGPGNFVHVTYVWLDAAGHVAMEGARTATPETIHPGETFTVPMTITAPTVLGTYTLVISPVQENVKWFYSTQLDAPGSRKRVDVFQTLVSRIFYR